MKSLGLIPVIFVSVSTWSQTCNLPLEQSAADVRFQLDASDSGVVVDLQTGLSWQRCAVGREIDDANTDLLSDDSCALIDQSPQDGVADLLDDDFNNDIPLTYSWYDALEYAAAEGNSWRLPNLKELSSLVEYSCYSPAINSHAFPDSVEADHWSSTISSFEGSSVWTIDFAAGTDDVVTKNTSSYILLVRD